MNHDNFSCNIIRLQIVHIKKSNPHFNYDFIWAIECTLSRSQFLDNYYVILETETMLFGYRIITLSTKLKKKSSNK